MGTTKHPTEAPPRTPGVDGGTPIWDEEFADRWDRLHGDHDPDADRPAAPARPARKPRARPVKQ